MTDLKIDAKAKSVKLELDVSFYGYRAILQAAKDYTDSCWVYMGGDANDKVLVTIKPKSDEISLDVVGYEFFNYVLGLMQNAIYE